MEAGKEAKREELARTLERRDGNWGGRSLTRRMPREEGPNASRRVGKGMLLECRSVRETVVGWAWRMGGIVYVMVDGFGLFVGRSGRAYMCV